MESCLVYFSQAVEPFDKHLASILTVSRQKNVQQGITGVMLYVRGSIVQVLEGDTQVVEQLYQRILLDPRHKQIELIMNRPITQRLFSEWNMGYETINNSQLAQIQAAVSLRSPRDAALTPDEPLVLRVIRTFYDANRYNPVSS